MLSLYRHYLSQHRYAPSAVKELSHSTIVAVCDNLIRTGLPEIQSGPPKRGMSVIG
jgi:hypothetical protein